jgi:hypothetical protein
MPHTHPDIRKLPAPALIAVLICLGLAACGGSSSKSTTNTSTNAANTSTSQGNLQGRFAAMRTCLQRNGIVLPTPTPGQGPRVLGGPPGGRQQLPKGVTREQFQAALKKCGGGTGSAGRGRRLFTNPAYRHALRAFAACMNSNGIKLAAPDTSGNGPVFNTKGINTASAQFRAASRKCVSILRSGFRRARPGTAKGGT